MVTFLFTDIEGSTQRWQQQPTAMGPALARHNRLVRDAIEAHGGAVFKTVGDAFCAAFADPTEALTAALTAQRSLYGEPWGSTGPLRVRMALHTGRAEVRDGDYAGAPLNRVARLLSAGHGGQVLLSGATAELVQDHLPSEVHLRDLGTHQLKDLYRPERIFQLVTPDLPADFSPLASADHLPPYPAASPPVTSNATAVRPAPAAPVRSSHRRAIVALAGGIVLALLALSGAYLMAGNESHPTPTVPPAAATMAPDADPFADGIVSWGTLATPPTAPAFVVLGQLIFDAGWQGSAQTLPGPMFVYVPEQPVPPTLWFGGPVMLTRAAVPGTPAQEETIAANSYVDLGTGDQVVVPANTPFSVQTGPYDVAGIATLMIFPSGPPATAPEVLSWQWWSWGTVEAWPSGPVEVLTNGMQLAPGESAPLPAQEWPQMIFVDAYSGAPLRLMLASGGGEAMPVGGLEGNQPIDLDAIVEVSPGTAGTPGTGQTLRGTRETIIPGTEATLGGALREESAFLRPGTGGTLRNPSEGREPVGVIIVTFGPPGTSS
jgi:class 3 adenylate cyclase